jgi:hypothetical protein
MNTFSHERKVSPAILSRKPKISMRIVKDIYIIIVIVIHNFSVVMLMLWMTKYLRLRSCGMWRGVIWPTFRMHALLPIVRLKAIFWHDNGCSTFLWNICMYVSTTLIITAVRTSNAIWRTIFFPYSSTLQENLRFKYFLFHCLHVPN